MIPLIFANVGEQNFIERVGGSPETKKHLENLGFVPGGDIMIISTNGGNIIVNVKGSRVAISREMANKIMVDSFDSGKPDRRIKKSLEQTL